MSETTVMVVAGGFRYAKLTDGWFMVNRNGGVLVAIKNHRECEILDALAAKDAEIEHMVVIGPLLDIWDGLPNDVKCDEELEQLRREIERLADIVEPDGPEK